MKFWIYLRIMRNRLVFKILLRIMAVVSDPSVKVPLIEAIAKFAVYLNTGSFNSYELEESLINIAKKYDAVSLNVPLKPKSCLHVMTQCYLHGGHTRVVERWIGLCPSEEIHSVVLLSQREVPIPLLLKEKIKEKNGQLYLFDFRLDAIAKALQLREISMQYEKIILHTHMYDPIPLIAFGTEKFKTPIILYNHADHVFWLGASIADIVANLREHNHNRYKIREKFVLSIPIDARKGAQLTQQTAREILHLPTDKKILLSVGSAYKYKAMLNYNYAKTIAKLLQRSSDLLVLIVGVNPNDAEWRALSKQFPQNFLAKTVVPNDLLNHYLFAADLYWDSFPVSGGTAFLDAVQSELPALSLQAECGVLDYIYQTSAYCKTAEILIDKTLELLADKNKRLALNQELQSALNQNNSPEQWLNNLKKLLSLTSTMRHQVSAFTTEYKIEDYDYYLSEINKAPSVGQAFKTIILMHERSSIGKKFYQNSLKILFIILTLDVIVDVIVRKVKQGPRAI